VIETSDFVSTSYPSSRDNTYSTLFISIFIKKRHIGDRRASEVLHHEHGRDSNFNESGSSYQKMDGIKSAFDNATISNHNVQ